MHEIHKDLQFNDFGHRRFIICIIFDTGGNNGSHFMQKIYKSWLICKAMSDPLMEYSASYVSTVGKRRMRYSIQMHRHSIWVRENTERDSGTCVWNVQRNLKRNPTTHCPLPTTQGYLLYPQPAYVGTVYFESVTVYPYMAMRF